MPTVRKREVLDVLGMDDCLQAIPAQLEPDFQGWNSSHTYLSDAVATISNPLIVEVGVWKGASTIHMAKELRSRGSQGVVIAVDTFLGSHEHFGNSHWYESLRARRGWPHLFYTFLDNVLDAGVSEYVLPLPLDSINAAESLATVGIHPDVVHIDAGHDHRSVARDLEVWFELLKPGGEVVCDDYSGWFPGVIRAVDEFRAARDIRLFETSLGKCRFTKPLTAEDEFEWQPGALAADDRASLVSQCIQLEQERDAARSRLALIEASRGWRLIERANKVMRRR